MELHERSRSERKRTATHTHRESHVDVRPTDLFDLCQATEENDVYILFLAENASEKTSQRFQSTLLLWIGDPCAMRRWRSLSSFRTMKREKNMNQIIRSYNDWTLEMGAWPKRYLFILFAMSRLPRRLLFLLRLLLASRVSHYLFEPTTPE